MAGLAPAIDVLGQRYSAAFENRSSSA